MVAGVDEKTITVLYIHVHTMFIRLTIPVLMLKFRGYKMRVADRYACPTYELENCCLSMKNLSTFGLNFNYNLLLSELDGSNVDSLQLMC